jgi:hypothetical protein
MFAGTQTRRVDPLQWTRQFYACSQREQARTVATNGRKDAHTADLYVTACARRRALGTRCRDIEHRVNAASGDRVVESIDVDRRVRCRCGPEARLDDWPPRTMRMHDDAVDGHEAFRRRAGETETWLDLSPRPSLPLLRCFGVSSTTPSCVNKYTLSYHCLCNRLKHWHRR